MVCKNCGKEIADKAVVCTNCGCAVKPKKSKKKLFIIIAVVFVVMCIAIGSSGTETGGTEAADGSVDSKVTETTVPEEFSGKCPVNVSATIADNIIGVPEISVHTKNKTEKDIAAVQYYLVGYDVYGEEVSFLMTNHKLSDDDGLKANSGSTSAWQLLDQEIKTGEIYVYSVYFADGTEWGNKDASTSNIKKYGMKVQVEQ